MGSSAGSIAAIIVECPHSGANLVCPSCDTGIWHGVKITFKNPWALSGRFSNTHSRTTDLCHFPCKALPLPEGDGGAYTLCHKCTSVYCLISYRNENNCKFLYFLSVLCMLTQYHLLLVTSQLMHPPWCRNSKQSFETLSWQVFNNDTIFFHWCTYHTFVHNILKPTNQFWRFIAYLW